jgi:hypothetical protein
LAIALQGRGNPRVLAGPEQARHSSQRGRIALLRRFVSQFGRDGIMGVLGDREFLCDLWWQWLSDHDIPYLMRMKGNQLLTGGQGGRQRPVRVLFTGLAAGGSRLLRKRRRIGRQWVWPGGMRLDSGELLILAGNQRFRQPLDTYGLRREIGNLCQCLKGRGFHLGETRLTRHFRIKKVMALVAIAFCWAHKAGEWKNLAAKPLKTKKHGRPEQSLFRYGLDHLTDSLFKGVHKTQARPRLWMLFLCPPGMIVVDAQNPDRIALRV